MIGRRVLTPATMMQAGRSWPGGVIAWTNAAVIGSGYGPQIRSPTCARTSANCAVVPFAATWASGQLVPACVRSTVAGLAARPGASPAWAIEPGHLAIRVDRIEQHKRQIERGLGQRLRGQPQAVVERLRAEAVRGQVAHRAGAPLANHLAGGFGDRVKQPGDLARLIADRAE